MILAAKVMRYGREPVSLVRQSLNVLTPRVGRPACPSGQIVKNVMRDAASSVFVFSPLRKHETMTLTFYKRIDREADAGRGFGGNE